MSSMLPVLRTYLISYIRSGTASVVGQGIDKLLSIQLSHKGQPHFAADGDQLGSWDRRGHTMVLATVHMLVHGSQAGSAKL